MRFNDVIADPQGRVFCGTYSEKGILGRLYRLDTDGSLHKILDDIGCSNAWVLPSTASKCITPTRG